jgi:transcriptional regulator with XRE-family HTH domain
MLPDSKRPHAAIGHRIRSARDMRGLTLAAFARALRLSSTEVWRYEAGVRLPRNDRLIEISDVLGVSLDHLLRGEQ